MTSTQHAPTDTSITGDQLFLDPYPIYKRLRAQTPVVRVPALNRTFLTKAADTKYVKNTPVLFSSNDPNTPMEPAFQAHTLMRKDGEAHQRERMAMQPAFSARVIKGSWKPLIEKIAVAYVDKLHRGETIDLINELAAPFASRCLAHILGIDRASDEQMTRWSQTLIDGAGNFAWAPEPFAASDNANAEMNSLFDEMMTQHKAIPDESALSVMVNSDDPIETSQIRSNIKIAIGGGINEPRDALSTILFGLLTNPDQFEATKSAPKLIGKAFDEGIRWCAPIQVSSRLVKEDTEIRNYFIPKGDTVMTIQASACHDEELYETPEKFNLFRENTPHQAFGNGPHFCQGNHVAKLMLADIMIPLLLERFPNMKLDKAEDVKWRGFGFRGPINLPIKLI